MGLRGARQHARDVLRYHHFPPRGNPGAADRPSGSCPTANQQSRPPSSTWEETLTPIGTVGVMVGIPRGDLPGWRQLVAQDFTDDVPVGGFSTDAEGNLLGGPYAGQLIMYPDGWADPGSVRYPSRVVSVHHSLLDIHLHTDNIDGADTFLSAVVSVMVAPDVKGQSYGRYVTRFRADPADGIGAVLLLFPSDNVWPDHGEINFPEGDLGREMEAFLHHADAAGTQEFYPVGARWTDWHVAEIEWRPGSVRLLLDGRLVGTSTDRVPSTPMNYNIQSGSSTGSVPPAHVSSHLQVDWVAIYAPSD